MPLQRIVAYWRTVYSMMINRLSSMLHTLYYFAISIIDTLLSAIEREKITMCINHSVGHFGRNHIPDVKMIQTLLNLNRRHYTSARPARLKVDGLIGKKTVDCISRYELKVMGLTESDSLITPDDPTLRSLGEGTSRSADVDKEKLIAFMPYALESNVDKYRSHLRKLLPAYGITHELQIVHFLSQLAHESGSFRFTEELASGEAYEGRADLGNSEKGDGKRFKGRGLIQLTGRKNYTAYSEATGIDYVKKPKLLSSSPKVAVDVACWFWKTHGLNELSRDSDDVRAVTRIINGGQNGIDDRIDFLRRARGLMGVWK